MGSEIGFGLGSRFVTGSGRVTWVINDCGLVWVVKDLENFVNLEVFGGWELIKWGQLGWMRMHDWAGV